MNATLLQLLLIQLLVRLVDTASARRHSIWHQAVVSWHFFDPHHLLSDAQFQAVRQLIISSFQQWSSALDGVLIIRESNSTTSDILIKFARGNHSCLEKFDGSGGVVAHSGYPPSGILHLDADEKWHTGDATKGDVDLRYVLIHEIGHVLGMRHSKHQQSVMHKDYGSSESIKSAILSKYDVRAIRRIYQQYE